LTPGIINYHKLGKISIFIKIDILKPSLIEHFNKKISIIIKIEQKSEFYATIGSRR